MRKVAIQQRSAEVDFDMGEEAQSEAGTEDPDSPVFNELAALRKRAAEHGLTPEASERYGVLLSKAAR
eukprot:3412840-Pyramimonas_sp.AAC.1